MIKTLQNFLILIFLSLFVFTSPKVVKAITCDTTIDGYCQVEAEIIEFNGMPEPAVSASSKGKMYFDSASGNFKCSEDGAAYANCVGTADLTSAVLWTFGDGSSGDVIITFDGDGGTDGTLTWDVSEDSFNYANVIKLFSDTDPIVNGPIDTIGDIAIDSNFWAAGRGAAILYDGTTTTALIGALVSDPPNNGEVPKWNTGGTVTWEPDDDTASVTVGDTQILYALSANSPGGEAAFYYDDTTNTLFVDNITLAPSATPTSAQYDSDTTDGDASTQLVTNCTDTGSGTEDCDFTMSQQIAGVMTAFLTADADGNNTITRLAATDAVTFQDAELEVPNTATDKALATAGEMHINTTDEQVSFHSAADGEISGEASLSLIRHLSATFDPAGWYDQESTYRVVPLMTVGDDSPEGITIVEWEVDYVGGNPTTELDADIVCDTTPDYNPAVGATVMDVIDTTTGASTADTGFDSATCANASKMYIRFGADPTDANVVVAFDLWFYNEED